MGTDNQDTSGHGGKGQPKKIILAEAKIDDDLTVRVTKTVVDSEPPKSK
ncbi:hypothetical protein [[Phormidium ambiguum] IAM M-71]|nr:hypothetical protein [Phormidium ambiguum]